MSSNNNSSQTTKKSNLKRKLEESEKVPKAKKQISFDDVTVYYFPRAQGFACVPTTGGYPLGMQERHSRVKKYSLVRYGNKQKKRHRQVLQQLRSESSGTDEISDGSDSPGVSLSTRYILQPMPLKQRRELLLGSVQDVDFIESDDCGNIRTSRKFCGCDCEDYCHPDTCFCSQAEIHCQVEKLNFPCKCSKNCCGNTFGRLEFDSLSVRNHVMHTLRRVNQEANKTAQVSATLESVNDTNFDGKSQFNPEREENLNEQQSSDVHHHENQAKTCSID